MSDWSKGLLVSKLPSELSEISDTEFQHHHEFVYRNIDFLIDTLTAEQCHRPWRHPNGCPDATPEKQCLSRDVEEYFPCKYESVSINDPSRNECKCGDPLCGSDDPLDAVAAVTISSSDRTPSERYFDSEDREIISSLKHNVGDWNDIAELTKTELSQELESATNRRGIDTHRVEQLHQLLIDVDNASKCDGLNLEDLPRITYDTFCEFLSGFPGISRSDAWWLMLVAFDKPVWPADPHIDALACNLGLIQQNEVIKRNERREELEERLSDRFIRQLHRALAGHATKGDVNSCSDTCAIKKFLLTHRHQKQSEHTDGPVLIDLFSGAGGLSLGFSEQEWDIEFAVDNDKNATDTFRFNHPEVPHKKVVCGDIRELMDGGIANHLDRQPDIVVGGPPCQSLSKAGDRTRLPDSNILDDERTKLYTNFVEAIENLQPKAFVMENVQGMMSEIGDSGVKVGELVINDLESIVASGTGYSCDFRLIDAVEYGIPQNRQRVIIIGVRNDFFNKRDINGVEEVFNHLKNKKTDKENSIKQGLSGLPKIKRGEGGVAVPHSTRGKRSEYVKDNEIESDSGLKFNHRAREHPMEKDRTLFDEALEPGDTGWDVKYEKEEDYSELIDYDVGTKENPRFKTKYRMLQWDEPSPTIIAHLSKDANGYILPDYYEHVPQAVGKPDNERNRGLTPREAARLQSFPDNYIFLGPFTSWFRQIGNAVPPILGRKIADTLSDFLNTKGVSGKTTSPIKTPTTDD